MNKKQFFLFTVMISYCILFLSKQAYGQKLHFEHLTINNGLSQNDVFSLMQDNRGYIWIGTLDGLNKYDGYKFTTYQRQPFKENSLTMNAVTGLWQFDDGELWVHPVNSDLNKFNEAQGTFAIFNPGPSAKFQFDPRLLQDLEIDSDGMIWAFNQEGQLCRFDKTDGHIAGDDYSKMFLNPFHKAASPVRISDLFKDRKGNLWIASSEGIHRVKFHSQLKGHASSVGFENYWHNRNDSNSVIPSAKMFEDHAGKIWLGNFQVLMCIDLETKRITKYRHEEKNINSLSDNRITNIAEDAQGNLWIATLNGLNKLDRDRRNFTRFFHDPNDPFSLGANNIPRIMIDRSNVLWIGTMLSGISKVNLNNYSFPLYQHNPFDRNSLSNNKVTSICEDKTGIVWIGTLEGGLNAWNRATGKFIHYLHDAADPHSLFSNAIGALLEDREGNLWIGSGINGKIVLSRLNRKTNRFEHHYLEYPIGNPYTILFAMYQDKEGLIWIGTVNGILTFDPHSYNSRHYPYYDTNNPDGLSDPWIFSFCEDKEGNMWAGTSTERVNKIDKNWKIKHYTYNPKKPGSISSHTARCIFKDSQGTLWLGTFGGGLCRFNPSDESFTAFTINEGLPSNTVHSIQEDDERNLWIGTGKGFSKFSLKNHSIANYDDKDGLQSNQFTVGHIGPGASFKGRDGTLYFGGINGFNAFHPGDFERNQYVPPIVINQFILFDKTIPGLNIANEIKLKYNQNFFSFEFAALDYTNSQKNQYAYKLEGVDKDWVYCGTNRFARYTNIPYGRHVFHVKGTNSDGIWNEKGASVLVFISPPWWRTNLAYAFYFLCFVLAAFAIHRYQRQRVIRKERERTKEIELQQAKEIEKAYHKLKETQAQLIQSEKMASLGELTAGIAHEIQNPLNFVNNFSEVNKELLSELNVELNKGNIDEAKTITKDVISNEEKIINHGKKADAIVKGMLQHSQSSSGVKEPTDLNALADEYLRLAYHGLRAKDHSFNAIPITIGIETDFDTSIEKISVVPQDIGRVLLNLINNAFYTVTEKQRRFPNGEYQPIVILTTKKADDKIRISVRDNGEGIPQKVLDKIFQPFFTTKPTGQGTGLGLSLAYDIVKAHSGELKVMTNESQGSEFIIQLPAKEI